MPKRLCPRSRWVFCQWSLQHLPLIPWSYADLVSAFAFSRKRQAEAPALAPLKVLKVSTSSTARWVVDAQAALQRGAASARADPKELVAQGEATEAATEHAGEEAPRTFEAEVAEARAPEVEVADTGAPRTTEAEVVEAGAAEPMAQDAEMEAGQAAVPPPVQDLPPSQESAQEVQTISSDDTSWGKEVADAEAASTVE